MRNCYVFISVTILAFLALGSCLYTEPCVFAQTDQTASKLQTANTAVEQAFSAVLDSEKAGANVTGLLVQLNTADCILAQSENSYRTGDSNRAAALAGNAFSIAQEVVIAAHDAKQTALVSGRNTFWITIAFTAIGTLVFVLVLFLFWRWFKQRYIKSLSKAKTEVNIQ